MPLPSKRKGDTRKKFVSRCVAELSRKGEGKDASQRAAICNDRFRRSKATEFALTDCEIEAIANAMGSAEKVTNLNPPIKKKKRDKYRITKEDGSGTDDTAK